MSTYTDAELRQLTITLADALCEHLAGNWRRTESPPAHAALTREGCELHLWGYEQRGIAHLTVQAQLPEGWGAVESVTPPEFALRADRDTESIAIDIARLVLPLHAEAAERVDTALKTEARRQAVSGSVTDHFLERMPGAVPDPHRPGIAVSSAGPAPFTSTLLVRQDGATADLHLRDLPVEFVRGLVDLTASLLVGEPEPPAAADQAVDALADAITAFASARKGIGLVTLLHETTLNIQILSRIASKQLPSPEDRDRLEELADELVDELRRLYRQHRDNDQSPAA
ncbi:hypothetical protein [Glycomyces harbinensis]|uniref:Uncharacterized protein n=1 Tax=Glycomyces harbinensis TaxID=58114 RepID=A0A1G6YCA2_9ACTN|nr:hypothetical protein [Glycomyces harbinensis]SDD87236.1 hypothetical protein SAMN05216270_108221 [Glycomyces harbinensis]